MEALYGKLMEVAGQGRASVNPATGAEEFFWPFDKIKEWFKKEPQIDPIEIKGERRSEKLYPPVPVMPQAKPEMRFYNPWVDDTQNRAYLQNQSDRFAKASNDRDVALMQKIYNETRKKALPSGIDLKRNPISAQEKEDFSLKQGIRLGSERNAEIVDDLAVQNAWIRNKQFDSGNHIVGSDGRVYWRKPEFERVGPSPTTLLDSWEQPLKGGHILDKLKRGESEAAVRDFMQYGLPEADSGGRKPPRYGRR